MNDVVGSNHSRSVYLWLMTGVILIMAMVVIGGITRLTQSGLSIVEWKPVTGIIPPLNEREWILEFEKYQQSPEYKFYNNEFTVSDFKSIFFWEYLHRLIARLIGFVFIIPCFIFWMRGKFNRSLKTKVVLIFAFGGFQGFLGWFMVKSGLVDAPHVSHLRLAIHFVSALLLIVFIYNTALSVKYGSLEKTTKSRQNMLFNLFGLLLLLQIVFGAFVAGLKAGKMFNTYPLMGDYWIPPDVGGAFKYLGAAAIWESPFVVQFAHRTIAILLILSGILVYRSFKMKTFKGIMNVTINSFLVVLLFQFLLGILTLIYAVPVWLGVLHQFVAIILVVLVVRIHFFSRRNVSNDYPALNEIL